MGGGPLDAGGHTLERHGQVLDPLDRQHPGQEQSERVILIDVGLGRGQGPDPCGERRIEHAGPIDRRPQLGQLLDGVERGIGGDHGPVEGTDRGPDDEVGLDTSFEQGLELANLVGAELTAPSEHEGGLRGPSLIGHGTARSLRPARSAIQPLSNS